nr:MAG TPA: hypothetical protein [Bacteriophage sp.]
MPLWGISAELQQTTQCRKRWLVGDSGASASIA